MATTTPNFGWTVPTSTDLVKDGATAIETLGDGIDASFVDLKGGTTGQVLSKASGTDLDFSWVAQDDSNAIQNAIVDAKGDLIAATANDTPARLAVGTNGQVLTADSAEATGLKWATPASTSTAVGCILYNSTNYTISNATDTLLTFNTEILDTDGFHSTSTNTSRITIPAGKGGKYYVFAWGGYANNTTGYRQLEILVNGRTGTPSRVGNSSMAGINNITLTPNGAAVLSAGDYIEVNAYQNSGGSLTFYGGAADCQFGAIFLGA